MSDIRILSTALDLHVGTAASVQLRAAGGWQPRTWAATAGPLPSPLPVASQPAYQGLPAGMTLDAATGVLSGTPTNGGLYGVTFVVTDAIGDSARVELLIDIDDPRPATATDPTGTMQLNECAPHEVWVTVLANRFSYTRNGAVFIFGPGDRLILPRSDAKVFRAEGLVTF